MFLTVYVLPQGQQHSLTGHVIEWHCKQQKANKHSVSNAGDSKHAAKPHMCLCKQAKLPLKAKPLLVQTNEVAFADQQDQLP